jgi:hypothetical protein
MASQTIQARDDENHIYPIFKEQALDFHSSGSCSTAPPGTKSRDRIVQWSPVAFSNAHDYNFTPEPLPHQLLTKNFDTSSTKLSSSVKAIEHTKSIANIDFRCFQHGCAGRTFSSSANFWRHMKEKNGHGKRYVCEYCGRSFTRSTAKSIHARGQRCAYVTSKDPIRYLFPEDTRQVELSSEHMAVNENVRDNVLFEVRRTLHQTAMGCLEAPTIDK